MSGFNLTDSVILTQTQTMIFVRTARVGYIEKAIDVYSRRGAENAKEDILTILSVQKTHVTSAFSAPLRENSMLTLQHKLVFRVYENRQQLSDQA